MTRSINQVQVTKVAARVSKEINSVGEMKFPNTIFLELGAGSAVLQLISSQPNQQIDPVKYANWLVEWNALNLEEQLKGLDYQEQVTLLCMHLPALERHLGMMIMANAATLHPTIPVIAHTYWNGLCYGPDGVEHREETIIVEVKRPTRIMGESELTPGLIDAIDAGVIRVADVSLDAPNPEVHKQVLWNIMSTQGAEDVSKNPRAKTGFDNISLRAIGEQPSLPKSSPFGRSEAPVLSLVLKGTHMAVIAESVEHATQLFLTMTDVDLSLYAEKTGLTIKEMQYSIALLRNKQIQAKVGYAGGNTGKPIYFLDIFDVESVSDYEMRKFQIMVSAQKTPEYKIEQMELNVKAHKLYISEMNRLMFYAKDMTQEKILDELYLLIHNVDNFSNDQMVHFHIELGEGLIGEFESAVDRGSWETMKRLFNEARRAVVSGIEAGQDVFELAGASFNAHSLGEEPMDVSERVDVFLEHQHDAFFVIPLELWNGK